MDLIENKTRFKHKIYGEGILKSFTNDLIVIEFDEYGEKKFTGQSIIEKKLCVINETNTESKKAIEYNNSQNVFGTYNVINAFVSVNPLIFNETYVVLGSKLSAPSIHANYNLIVIGDIYCDDIDVNGSLIVIGDAQFKSLVCNKDVVCTGKLSVVDGDIESNVFVKELKSNRLHCKGNVNIQTIVDIKNLLNIEGTLFASEGILGKGELLAKAAVAGDYIDFDGSTPKKSLELSEYDFESLKYNGNTTNIDRLIASNLSKNIDLSSDSSILPFIASVSEIANTDVYRISEWSYLVKNIINIVNKNDISDLRECLLAFYAEKYLPNEIKYDSNFNVVFSNLLSNSIERIEELEYTANNIYDISFSIKVIDEFGTELCESKDVLFETVFDFIGLKYDTVKRYLRDE